jgi:hypothetical protein
MLKRRGYGIKTHVLLAAGVTMEPQVCPATLRNPTCGPRLQAQVFSVTRSLILVAIAVPKR